jgi:hypothetical protein
VSDKLIQAAGRWRSWCFALYIELSDESKRRVMQTALACSSAPGLEQRALSGAEWRGDEVAG